MTTFQRVVKYCAIVFAVMLAVSIISLIIQAGVGVISGLHLIDKMTGTSVFEEIEVTDDDFISYTKDFETAGIENLEIHNYYGTMVIKAGDTFHVEAVNVPENFIAEVQNNTLYIGYEENPASTVSFWFNWNNWNLNTEITITVPESYIADQALINSGSGKITIDGVNADQLVVDSGSGSVTISNCETQWFDLDSGSGSVTASEIESVNAGFNSSSGSVKISDSDLGAVTFDSGSGSVTMEEVDITDFMLDSGSGRVKVSDGSIRGNITINSGSGYVTVVADGIIDLYDIDTDAGSGGIWINGEKKNDYEKDNKGNEYNLTIDGGSGRVSVDLN